MDPKQTINCVVCCKPVRPDGCWTGHVIRKPLIKKQQDERVIAGFCKDHRRELFSHYVGNTGCFGVWHKAYGIEPWIGDSEETPGTPLEIEVDD